MLITCNVFNATWYKRTAPQLILTVLKIILILGVASHHLLRRSKLNQSRHTALTPQLGQQAYNPYTTVGTAGIQPLHHSWDRMHTTLTSQLGQQAYSPYTTAGTAGIQPLHHSWDSRHTALTSQLGQWAYSPYITAETAGIQPLHHS